MVLVAQQCEYNTTVHLKLLNGKFYVFYHILIFLFRER